jgi:hypothetical protein
MILFWLDLLRDNEVSRFFIYLKKYRILKSTVSNTSNYKSSGVGKLVIMINRRLIVMSILFIFSNLSYSQTLDVEPQLIIRDSLSNGKYFVKTYFDKKGKKIQSEGIEINGLKDSVWVNYFKDGKVRIRTNFEVGSVVDIIEQYNENNISLSSVYKNNNYSYLTFYNKKGQVELEVVDSYNSKYYRYYCNAKLSKTIESDTLNRVETVYLKTGYVHKKTEYKCKNNLEDYYVYNIVRELVFYEGELLYIYYYDEKGKIIKEEYFNGGKLAETINR